LYGVTVLNVLAKLQEATKKDDVLVQSMSWGSSTTKSASVPLALNLESQTSFLVTPMLI